MTATITSALRAQLAAGLQALVRHSVDIHGDDCPGGCDVDAMRDAIVGAAPGDPRVAEGYAAYAAACERLWQAEDGIPVGDPERVRELNAAEREWADALDQLQACVWWPA